MPRLPRLAVLAVAALAAAAGLAGCSAPDPEATLPGVHTASTVTDSFRCGELLLPDGCPLLRLPSSLSGCQPEVPGYAVCTAWVNWTAVSGAALPGSRLVVSVNGTDVESCPVDPQAHCSLAGNATFRHSFGGPGERADWTLAVRARLEAPGEAPPATGEFSVALTLLFKADPA